MMMDLKEILVPILVAVVCFLTFMFILNRMQKESVRKRLMRLAPTKEEAEETVERQRDGQATGLAATLEPILMLMGLRPSEYRRLHFYRFYRAGVNPVDGPILYLAWKWLTTPIAILFIVAALSQPVAPLVKALYFIFCGIVFVLTFFGGDIYLKNERDKRAKTLTRSFPDTLDLLLVCTESGLALDAAMARVCRELDNAHPMMTEELNKNRLELTLINDRPRALQNLAERTDLVPFRSLVASLLQTERFGTSLTETLRVLSSEYRYTRLMLAEQKAGRLPVLITLPLILLLMPAFFLIVMGPGLIKASSVW